jgi:glutamine amidotransferase
MIAIVDYKAGNLTSVAGALAHLGHRCEITDRLDKVRAADRVILPGVGAAGATMENLHALGLDECLRNDVAKAGRPFLGICIGIQVLFDRSDEDGGVNCLGIVPGKVVKFPPSIDGRPLKVPQIGWNRVHQEKPHPIFVGVPDNTHFYFVNSYYPVADKSVVIGTSDYGVPFTAAIARDNVIATQFHLEKSGSAGLRMLDNFCRMKF